MESNIGTHTQFNEEFAHNSDFSTSKNSRVNFQEFKHNVLLHEKGLAMQESSNKPISTNSVKAKHKSVSHPSKPLTGDQISENQEEVSELSLRFKERHI